MARDPTRAEELRPAWAAPLLGLAVSLGPWPLCLPATLKVPGDHASIQEAIDAAEDGDTVIVAPGEYRISEPILFRAKRIAVTSEAGPEETVIRMSDPRDPAWANVLAFYAEEHDSVLDGFTLTGGAGSWSRWGGVPRGGGGVLCSDGASPTLSRLIIAGNSDGVLCLEVSSPVIRGCTIARNRAGGITCFAAAPLIEDCVIADNSNVVDGTAELLSSGIYCQEGSSPTIARCVVSGNAGGGIFCVIDSSPAISDCVITRNRLGGLWCLLSASPVVIRSTISGNIMPRTGGTEPDGWGGGVVCVESSPSFSECEILGNVGGAGGVYCDGSSPTFSACAIAGNAAAASGGGLYLFRSSPSLVNCLLLANSARETGGGLHCEKASSPSLVNCTVAGNAAPRGAGVHSLASSPRLANCVVWGNVAGAFEADAGSGPEVRHSCIEGPEVVPGDGNISADPLFISPGRFDFARTVAVAIDGRAHVLPNFVLEAGDYRLAAGSPAQDSGSASESPPLDLDGRERPCGPGVDMGAYESCEEAPGGPRFLRGEANGDGSRNIADAVSILGHLFQGAEAPPCMKAADVDDSGRLDIGDAVRLLAYLFLGGPRPAEPFGACGTDPIADELGCERSPPCG